MRVVYFILARALSADIDRDGVIAPPDLLELIDLLIGTGAYDPWLGSTVPGDSTMCP
ncbi:MAG: hypothetical protein IID38_07265 [Planctomycetes bacterium]|nr:hypothetical protein [Planctomycetota bacterium]